MHYSLLITSCDRHGLLKETLDSFIRVQCGGIKPRDTFIVEDGPTPMPDWLRSEIHYYASHLGKITWVNNETRQGQIYSADRLWGLCTQDYAFWMEDDWRFDGGNFMLPSFEILAKHPEVITVSLRGNTGWHQLIDQAPFEGFKIAMPGWKGGWGGFTFNCGVRRRSDYSRIGSYGASVGYGRNSLGHEMDLSRLYLTMGYRIADLGRTIAVHIGGAFSRSVGFTAPLPRILVAVPVCHAFSYGAWESGDSPLYDKSIAHEGKPYGTKIHVSGPNNRIPALRDTWLRDAEAFKSHVDVRLFYGSPSPTDFVLKSDEVLLDCRDTYGDLPAKTIAVCKYAVEHGYDFIFKADDDSFVWIDRLVHECLSYRFMDYAGFRHACVCGGGPGYWLSRKAFTCVAEHGHEIKEWAEDVMVSRTLHHHSMLPMNLEGHRSGMSSHYFDISKFISASTVTIHAVTPEDMRTLYARERSR
jgi:Galactosyltransferase